MNTSLTPTGRRVLVKREEAAKQVNGIFLPDTAQDKNQEAIVVALGTGFDDDGRPVAELFSVKPGDRVLIAKYGGTEVQHEGKPHTILSDLDILGIIMPSGDGGNENSGKLVEVPAAGLPGSTELVSSEAAAQGDGVLEVLQKSRQVAAES